MSGPACAALMPAIIAALDDMFREHLPQQRVQFFVLALQLGERHGAVGANSPGVSLSPADLEQLRQFLNNALDEVARRQPIAGHA